MWGIGGGWSQRKQFPPPFTLNIYKIHQSQSLSDSLNGQHSLTRYSLVCVCECTELVELFEIKSDSEKKKER